MNILRLSLLFVSITLFFWQLFSFLSFDERALDQGQKAKAKPLFIDMDGPSSEDLKAALDDLEALPTAVLQKPRAKDFGRKQIFLPDAE